MKLVFLVTTLAASVLAETPTVGMDARMSAEPGLYAILRTSVGSITAKLFEKEAPLTVNSFVGLANGTQPWKDPQTGAAVKRPLYRNMPFDHIVPDYAIQTGDPTGTGRYDCGVRVKDEFAEDLQFDRPGRLGIMNFGVPDSGSCEFFITNDAYAALDRYPGNQGYTIFGQVVEGQEIVEKISNLPRDAHDRPRMQVRLVSVTIQRVGPGPAISQPRILVAPTRPTKLPKLD